MPAKPNWKEFGLFTDAESNRIAMEAKAQESGIELTDADRKEIRQIAIERADLMTRIKAAVIANNQPEAIRLFRELLGPSSGGGEEQLVRARKD